jgi:hypothetical protein
MGKFTSLNLKEMKKIIKFSSLILFSAGLIYILWWKGLSISTDMKGSTNKQSLNLKNLEPFSVNNGEDGMHYIRIRPEDKKLAQKIIVFLKNAQTRHWNNLENRGHASPDLPYSIALIDREAVEGRKSIRIAYQNHPDFGGERLLYCRWGAPHPDLYTNVDAALIAEFKSCLLSEENDTLK